MFWLSILHPPLTNLALNLIKLQLISLILHPHSDHTSHAYSFSNPIDFLFTFFFFKSPSYTSLTLIQISYSQQKAIKLCNSQHWKILNVRCRGVITLEENVDDTFIEHLTTLTVISAKENFCSTRSTHTTGREKGKVSQNGLGF
jgi:hypothetical protein